MKTDQRRSRKRRRDRPERRSRGRRRWWLGWLTSTVALVGCLAGFPAAAVASLCGHFVYHYRASGRYHAVFAGLDYHSGIYARRLRCRDAQHFVRDYARGGFTGASSRNAFFPPGSIDGFRCHRVRDGDDSGRNYCVRNRARVFFSDSDGQFG